jgi:antitoxin component of MazEF toxin-antitoxin module
MVKTKVIDKLFPVNLRKIVPYGNSKAIPIPSSIVKDLGLNEGDRLVVSINKELEVIVLSKPENLADKNSDVSYKLSIPKELLKDLIQHETD